MTYAEKVDARHDDIAKLLEVQHFQRFVKSIASGRAEESGTKLLSLKEAGISKDDYRLCMQASIATLCLHTEARIADWRRLLHHWSVRRGESLSHWLCAQPG